MREITKTGQCQRVLHPSKSRCFQNRMATVPKACPTVLVKEFLECTPIRVLWTHARFDAPSEPKFHQDNSSSSQSLSKIDRKFAKNSKSSKKSALSPKSRNPRKTYPDINSESVRNQVQKFQSPDLKVWRVPPIDKATRTDLWLGLEFILGTNCGSQESVKSGKRSKTGHMRSVKKSGHRLGWVQIGEKRVK